MRIRIKGILIVILKIQGRTQSHTTKQTAELSGLIGRKENSAREETKPVMTIAEQQAP